MHRRWKRRIQRIEALVEQIERSADARVRDTCREIVGTLLELHGTGLKRVFELLANSSGGGRDVIHACLEDDLLRSLLLLHDLHPDDLQRRVTQALEMVRPYLHSHGGDVELLEISPAGVRLRMKGSCHGCPSSAATLRDSIERAICELAPDVGTIEVEGLSSGANHGTFVPLDVLQGSGSDHSSGLLPSRQAPVGTNGHSSIAFQTASQER